MNELYEAIGEAGYTLEETKNGGEYDEIRSKAKHLVGKIVWGGDIEADICQEESLLVDIMNKFSSINPKDSVVFMRGTLGQKEFIEGFKKILAQN